MGLNRYLLSGTAVLALSVSSPSSAQEVHEAEPIDITGEPRGESAGEATGGNNAPDRENSSSRSNSSNNVARTPKQRLFDQSPNGKSHTVYLDGEAYEISYRSHQAFTGFLESQKAAEWGSHVASFGALVAIVGYFTIFDNPWAAALDTYIKMNSFDPLFEQLIATKTFNRAIHVQMIDYIENERGFAVLQNEPRKNILFWNKLLDMVKKPEKYLDGGLQRDPSGALISRPMAGQAYDQTKTRYVNALDMKLLADVRRSLSGNPAFTDYIEYVAMTNLRGAPSYNLYVNNGFVPMTAFDEVYINHALRALNCSEKSWLQGILQQNANNPNFSPDFINRLVELLRINYRPGSEADGLLVASNTIPSGEEEVLDRVYPISATYVPNWAITQACSS